MDAFVVFASVFLGGCFGFVMGLAANDPPGIPSSINMSLNVQRLPRRSSTARNMYRVNGMITPAMHSLENEIKMSLKGVF